MTEKNLEKRALSLGKLAFFTIGAAVIVLVLSLPIIFIVAQFSPLAALIIAFVALIAAVVAMGLVSNRLVNAEVKKP